MSSTAERSKRSGVFAAERAYFAAVGLLALWVGLPAFLTPKHVDKVLPFSVPPLHSRLIGAMYFSGFVLMVSGLLARRWAAIRWIPMMIAIWTGGLLLVTLLHHDAFDFNKTQTRVWLGAYVAYPVIGILITVYRRRDPAGDDRGPVPAGWARACLAGQGVVLTAVGLALLFVPGTMARGWPWPVDPLVAQIYSAPLLAYGIGSLLLARVHRWWDMRVGVAGIALFALAALVASLIHRELFAWDDPAAWVWFAALGAVTALAVVMAGSTRSAP